MGELKYRTLRENVVAAIRAKILDGQLEPGSRVIEQELAAEFGISRGPVREALRQLEQEGMIEYSRNVGCSVKGVSMEDVYEIYMLRASYEIIAVKMCDGKFTETELSRMASILESMSQLQCDEFRKVAEYDILFHEIIINKAHLPRVKKAWKELDYGAVISCYISYDNRGSMVERQYEIHKQLLDVCRQGHKSEICKAISTHYGLTLQRNMEERKLQDLDQNVFEKVFG